MSQEISAPAQPLLTEAPPGHHVAATQGGARARLAALLRRWAEAAGATAARAQRRITENFRVPPGGA